MVEAKAMESVTAPPAATAAVAADESNTEDAASSTTGAVAESLQKKADLSYYFAHGRPREDLTEAKKLEGKNMGNIDAQGNAIPEPITDESDERFFKRQLPDTRIEMLKKYVFEDAGKDVKMHVDFGDKDILIKGETSVHYNEDGLGIRVDVMFAERKKLYRFLVQDQPFYAAINPDRATYRVSSDKTRLVFRLPKVIPDQTWPTLLEKKMSQHTGWE
ncbi:unnamed protein product [Amoebophrya sp. A25]|nr:unnamed protein product [Amoebophrya sp. A25]|eukprot:GSA25T00011243001.1